MTPVGHPASSLSEGDLAGDEWIAVDDGGTVATARRRAAGLARLAGIRDARVSEVEIIASELATNLFKHAGGGDLVIRPITGGIQLTAVDAGPGTRDIEALIGAGMSTAGTLGLGLGAVRRLSSRLELWSEPGRGAVVVADVLDADPDDAYDTDDELAAAAPRGRPELEPGAEGRVGRLLRSIRGETACGDAIATRRIADGWLIMLADGLGHGPLAAEASHRATRVFDQASSDSPADLVRRMHQTLAGTRGAAVAVSRIDTAERVLTHAAVGNIAGRMVGDDRRSRSLISQPGIVGYRLPRVRETRYELGDAQLVVLHSDGLTEKWHDTLLPPVTRHGAMVCAAVLLRDAGTRRDDAGVVTLQVTP